MNGLLNFKRDLLVKNIRERIDQKKIDLDLPDNRFLLFEAVGTTAYSDVAFQDNAQTAAEIAAKAFERAPRPQGFPNYNSHPYFERGVILDVATDEILAYMFKSV